MERSFIHKRALLTVVLLISFVFTFSVVSLLERKDVRADGGADAGAYGQWDDPDGANIWVSAWGFNNGDVIQVTLYPDHECFVSSTGDYEVITDGDYIVIQFTFDGAGRNLYVSGFNIGDLSITSCSATLIQPAATTTTTTTAAPTSTPTPTPRPTTPPTTAATTAATTRATTTATTAATTAATTTAAPAGDDEDSSSGGEETTPVEVTETAAPSETSETSETDETTEETSEETSVDLDNPTLVAGATAARPDGESEETTEGDTPTPTPPPHIVASTKKHSGSFPWWLLICVILIGAASFRYKQLKKKDYYGLELAYEFIPGRVIGNIADKIFPPKAPDPSTLVPEEEKPKVINGYLQTSNTRAIRPEFSNAAALAKMETKAPAQDTSIPGLKPPVKRPSSASVNHAAVAAAAEKVQEEAGVSAAEPEEAVKKSPFKKNNDPHPESTETNRAIMDTEKESD